MIVEVPATTGFDATFQSFASTGLETRDGAARIVKMASNDKDDDDDDSAGLAAEKPGFDRSVLTKRCSSVVEEAKRLFPNIGTASETNSEKFIRKKWMMNKIQQIRQDEVILFRVYPFSCLSAFL